MNSFEYASSLLELCPIPESIQQCIFSLLIGFGTPSTKAMKNATLPEEVPIRVVALGMLDRCRHTLYYMERTISHCYDNASHFSREALFELHKIYLSNKRPTAYTITKTQELNNRLQTMSRKRLLQFIVEESQIK